MKEVLILGSGCATCKMLEAKVRALITQHSLDAEVEKISDLKVIMGYGILSTPGLVVDGVVKSSGTVPKDDQILAWLKG